MEVIFLHFILSVKISLLVGDDRLYMYIVIPRATTKKTIMIHSRYLNKSRCSSYRKVKREKRKKEGRREGKKRKEGPTQNSMTDKP